MAANREECFEALFARLQEIELFKFTSRVFQPWGNTPPSQSPAMFMNKGPETPTNQDGLPPVWQLDVTLDIYVRNDMGRNYPPSKILNELLTAVEEKLQRSNLEPPNPIFQRFVANLTGTWGTTLGGLCVSCNISSQTDVIEGVADEDAVAIVTISILTTG